MKEILRLSVTQIRIFATDTLGYRYFRSPSSIADLKQRYGFDTQASPFDGLPIESPSIAFTSGQFAIDDKKYLIESLTLEDRRIVFTISASSSIADRFFENLLEVLKAFDLREPGPKYDVLVLAQETICIARLDLKFEDLLCNSQESIHKGLETLSALPGYKVRIFPTSIKFAVRYLDIPEEMKTHNVTMIDKDIVIEIRAKTDPSDGIFFTQSPFNSDSHLKLLSIVEDAVRTRK
jgi:hypothetical protein